MLGVFGDGDVRLACTGLEPSLFTKGFNCKRHVGGQGPEIGWRTWQNGA